MQTPIVVRHMLRLSFKNIYIKKDMYYDEIKLRAQNKDIILGLIFNMIGDIYVIVLREGRIFDIIFLNCASQLLRLNFFDM